jgi:hypothetical protein
VFKEAEQAFFRRQKDKWEFSSPVTDSTVAAVKQIADCYLRDNSEQWVMMENKAIVTKFLRAADKCEFTVSMLDDIFNDTNNRLAYHFYPRYATTPAYQAVLGKKVL